MSTLTDDVTITTEEARELVQRAAFLIRSRPFEGSDPLQAAGWKRSVEDFLEDLVFERAIGQVGVTPPTGAPKATSDVSAFLQGLDHALGGHEDNPAVIVAVAITAIVVTVVGGIIVSYIAGEDAGAPPPPPVIVNAGG
ncbi:hypothetical protein I6A60_19805 [Frankia sp. AgB1.9]|uniref:hypothetical protein n=1 Tax=unclassified Frankia TaxID=2632575 RepID=UPI00193214E6|nr:MULTISPECIES: hypothetical protein [unclassified Frankia]MBL7494425.1 hypothetical protein [Frankia sp. AgW1.1]MBL7550108.1 hypothetical protein [Frankia sp. AgB1.9]MBL7621148.1 hypothetical protein [Frankia sp. AgB1.8]